MIASNDHGRPSLAPGCTCGELLTLPQVYLDLIFHDPQRDPSESLPARHDALAECCAAE